MTPPPLKNADVLNGWPLTILILFASLSVWGDFDLGCPDKSDIVKEMKTNTPQDPCGGETYTSPDGDSIDVTWDWFPCYGSLHKLRLQLGVGRWSAKCLLMFT